MNCDLPLLLWSSLLNYFWTPTSARGFQETWIERFLVGNLLFLFFGIFLFHFLCSASMVSYLWCMPYQHSQALSTGLLPVRATAKFKAYAKPFAWWTTKKQRHKNKTSTACLSKTSLLWSGCLPSDSKTLTDLLYLCIFKNAVPSPSTIVAPRLLRLPPKPVLLGLAEHGILCKGLSRASKRDSRDDQIGAEVSRDEV